MSHMTTIATTNDPQVAYHTITAALAENKSPSSDLLRAIETGTPQYFTLPVRDILATLPQERNSYLRTEAAQKINQARLNLIMLLGRNNLCPHHVLQSSVLGWIKTSRLFDTSTRYNGKYIVSALRDCTDYNTDNLAQAGFTKKQIQSLT